MGGQNFPDPCVIRTQEGWTAFSTNSRVDNKLVHIQVAKTSDYNSWNFLRGFDALPNLPSWVDQSNPRVWAPDVVQVSDGSFVMYFAAATNQDTSKHCLGVATSSMVNGPYTPTSNTPWICPLSQGGAIDVSGYFDQQTSQRYVVYKIDGNAIGHGGECGNTVAPIAPTPIMIQRVGNNGRDLIGGPSQILTNIASDGPYVEAPVLNKMNGKYVLFFSANCFATPKYDVQFATADNILGPYTRRGQIFKTGSKGMTAPGGLDINTNGNKAVWHA
ncbi:glycoside hydrolase family 43 protein [Polychaeton citri CBS 116435]|uniref:Glycoside hydrolase family 43 protein n=1 Tax=Polychaeton citri CBS 116435 TaxID=1314669 RepID=A0A9P4UPW4_9PEZI|nr:glycoside hydrolase family 43 protein [Polychaeton citri CBS 116435]